MPSESTLFSTVYARVVCTYLQRPSLFLHSRGGPASTRPVILLSLLTTQKCSVAKSRLRSPATRLQDRRPKYSTGGRSRPTLERTRPPVDSDNSKTRPLQNVMNRIAYKSIEMLYVQPPTAINSVFVQKQKY